MESESVRQAGVRMARANGYAARFSLLSLTAGKDRHILVRGGGTPHERVSERRCGEPGFGGRRGRLRERQNGY